MSIGDENRCIQSDKGQAGTGRRKSGQRKKQDLKDQDLLEKLSVSLELYDISCFGALG